MIGSKYVGDDGVLREHSVTGRRRYCLLYYFLVPDRITCCFTTSIRVLHELLILIFGGNSKKVYRPQLRVNYFMDLTALELRHVVTGLQSMY
jgi:hypothetical protein